MAKPTPEYVPNDSNFYRQIVTKRGTKLDLNGSGGTYNLRSENIPDIVAALKINTKITHLDVSYNKNLTADDIAKLLEIKTLRSLNVSNCWLYNDSATLLANQHHLTALHAANNSFTDDGLKALAKNKTLRTLNVSYSSGGCDGIMAVIANRTIEHLDVAGHENIILPIAELVNLVTARNREISKLKAQPAEAATQTQGRSSPETPAFTCRVFDSGRIHDGRVSETYSTARHQHIFGS